jgi:cholinesterase
VSESDDKMSDFVIAETEYGSVRGIRRTSVLNDDFIAFLGIPYATPPLGELRFKVSYSCGKVVL